MRRQRYKKEGPWRWIGGIIGAILILGCGIATMILAVDLFLK